ncbi:MAG TPA: DUF1015 domain-containing protein [Actinomycetota bacterium]
MPLVSPFTGLLFDEARAGSLASVTAPPYDSISAEQERRLHSANPHNVVRLILGRDEPGDDDQRNKYTRAGRELRTWRRAGVLIPTETPSWFLYEMRFSFQGRDRRIRGLIGEVEIEPFGGSILPHERTLPGPIEDRLSLLRAARANLSPVYALFGGPQPGLAALFDQAAAGEPHRGMTDDHGVEHRMWVIPAPSPSDGSLGSPQPDAGAPSWSSVPGWLAPEQLLIADGHHRYSVAQAFAEEMRREHGPGPWDRMMMLLVDAATEDPPVLPIHRVVLSGDAPVEGRRVRDLAEVLAAVDDDALVYGSAAREDGRLIHRVAALEGWPPTVCALHERVLGSATLRFMPDAAAAEEAVHTGAATSAFFLPPTRVERIRGVIRSGGTLPQKSTYFWPKPRTGMVIRPFD